MCFCDCMREYQSNMVVVAFIHPDLGIGGAERLVVDAALALQNTGHKVHIFTAHHDRTHCFEETRDGTLQVTCVGDWLPRHVFGHCYALFAYLRMIYVALYLVLFSDYKSDIFFCDQVSACVPVLKLSPTSKVLFYCHFPDQLLTKRQSIVKKLYRAPLDALEEKTTGMADCLLVNSNFTAQTFYQTFTTLKNKDLTVLYPSLNVKTYDVKSGVQDVMDAIPDTAQHIFLSINRYERKKNLHLALRAFLDLKRKVSTTKWETLHLIIAGGYDERVTENKEHYSELVLFTDENNLSDHVTFLRSISDHQKLALFRKCSCLLYTPTNEHFGIVPIEAMYMEKPVIAVNTGGPLETVLHEKTGFLCASNEDSFANAMLDILTIPDIVKVYGENGKAHVLKNFSFQAFSHNLDEIVCNLYKTKSSNDFFARKLLVVSIFLIFIVIVIYNI